MKILGVLFVTLLMSLSFGVEAAAEVGQRAAAQQIEDLDSVIRYYENIGSLLNDQGRPTSYSRIFHGDGLVALPVTTAKLRLFKIDRLRKLKMKFPKGSLWLSIDPFDLYSRTSIENLSRGQWGQSPQLDEYKWSDIIDYLTFLGSDEVLRHRRLSLLFEVRYAWTAEQKQRWLDESVLVSAVNLSSKLIDKDFAPVNSLEEAYHQIKSLRLDRPETPKQRLKILFLK